MAQDHEQYFDYTCNYLCVVNNKVNESVQFCTECIRHLCSSCLETHTGIHKTHRLVEPLSSSQYGRNNTITEHCRKHPGKVSDLFCRSHDAVICSACVPDHHSCGPVLYIPEDVHSIFRYGTVQWVSDQLAELGSVLDSLKIVENDVQKSIEDKERVISEIKGYSAKLMNMIKSMENKAIREVITNDETRKSDLRTIEEEFVKMKTELKDCLSNLLTADENKPQQFVCMKNGQQLIKSADQLLQTALRRSENQTCGFAIDSDVQECLAGCRSLITRKSQQSQPLSDLHSQTNPGQQTGQQETKQPHKQASKLQAHGKTPTTSQSSIIRTGAKIVGLASVHKYNVRGNDDRAQCAILGCCLLPSSYLVLSDNSNDSLKLFEPTTNTVEHTLKMKCKPRGVCCVSRQVVAVALDKKTIQFVTATPSLTLSKSFRVDHECWGIEYRDDCLFVTDFDTKVYIHNLDGSLIQVINVPGAPYTWDVALSPGGELLYVTNNTGLTCLERSGQPVYTKEVGGGSCRGVCVDESGRVMVCNLVSQRVVHVGKDGEVLAELLGSGVKWPRSICVDSDSMTLYVTQFSNDEIIVAQLMMETHV